MHNLLDSTSRVTATPATLVCKFRMPNLKVMMLRLKPYRKNTGKPNTSFRSETVACCFDKMLATAIYLLDESIWAKIKLVVLLNPEQRKVYDEECAARFD